MQFYSRPESDRKFSGAAVEVGTCYQRVQVLNVTETAEVVALRSDYYGVPHVQFTLTCRLGPKIMDCEDKLLAVETFLQTYRPINSSAGVQGDRAKH